MFTNGSPIYPSMPAPSPSNRPDGVLSRYALAGCALLLSACSGSGEEESPTPEVTPTATVVPTQSVYYRITSLAISGTNPDGSTSALQSALDAMEEVVYLAIYDAVCTDIQPVIPCLTTLETTLDDIFSVETISNAINRPIESSDVSYLVKVEGQGTVLTLTWSTGAFQATGYSVEETLVTLSGSLEADGSGTVGPSDIPLTVLFTDPISGEVLFESTLTLYQSTLQLTDVFGSSLTAFAYSGIKPDELTALMLELAEALIPSNEPLPGTLEAEVLAAVQPYLDLDLDGDGTNDALSLLAVINGDVINIVE